MCPMSVRRWYSVQLDTCTDRDSGASASRRRPGRELHGVESLNLWKVESAREPIQTIDAAMQLTKNYRIFLTMFPLESFNVRVIKEFASRVSEYARPWWPRCRLGRYAYQLVGIKSDTAIRCKTKTAESVPDSGYKNVPPSDMIRELHARYFGRDQRHMSFASRNEKLEWMYVGTHLVNSK